MTQVEIHNFIVSQVGYFPVRAETIQALEIYTTQGLFTFYAGEKTIFCDKSKAILTYMTDEGDISATAVRLLLKKLAVDFDGKITKIYVKCDKSQAIFKVADKE